MQGLVVGIMLEILPETIFKVKDSRKRNPDWIEELNVKMSCGMRRPVGGRCRDEMALHSMALHAMAHGWLPCPYGY